MTGFFFLLIILWFGFVLDEEFSLSRGDFPVRLAAAIILGGFWGTWMVFLFSWLLGFGPAAIGCTLALILGLNAWAWKFRGRNLRWIATPGPLNRDFWLAAAIPTALITGYFAFSAVWINHAGDIVFRGNSQDLAFHMATASAFLEQSAFPPLNPQSAAAKLSYHFMADFFPAILCRGGFDLFGAMKLTMVLFAFSLCTLTCHFVYSVVQTRRATLLAGLLFFFGHIGVVNLLFALAGHPAGSGPLSLRSWSSIADHLTYPYYNFLNVVIDYFQPQLPFLFGFPLAMLLLTGAFRHYVRRTPARASSWFMLAMVAFLPLFHMHTFLTIGPLLGLMVLLEPDTPAGAKPRWFSWRKVLLLTLALVPIALQFRFLLSQPKAAGFSGFDVAATLGELPELPGFRPLKRVWFWIRAGGIPLVLGLAAMTFFLGRFFRTPPPDRRKETALLAFFGIGTIYFIVINFFRLTPNWGDSNKFFLYWDLALCLYAARLLERWWDHSAALRIAGIVLVATGAVLPTVVEWTVRYSRGPERLFSASDRLMAEWIRLNTPRDSVFLTANSIVHFVPALAGRRVVNGAYTRETGFADDAIEQLVARAYREASPWLIDKVNVTHVMVGPQEEGLYHINRPVMNRRHRVLYDETSLGVGYTVYETRSHSPAEIRREIDEERARPFVWLSELEPAVVAQQYGVLKFDRSLDLHPLSLHGQVYPTGLGTHANSEIQYKLEDQYAFFESDLGLDDSQTGGSGSIVFEVWLDDRQVYKSNVMHVGDAPAGIRIDLTGATTLRLIVSDAGDGNHCDHGNWAGARLIRRR